MNDSAPTADSIVVFTSATSHDIIASEGSGHWVLNPKRARQCKYLVCCRKPHWNNMEDQSPSGSAFLVGTIKKLVPKLVPRTKNKNKPDQQRYFVEIGQYASVSKEGVWKEWRNPVRYDSLENLGIDAQSLKFEPVGSPGGKPSGAGEPTAGAAQQGLTIAAAKEGLALAFGVRPEDVEIRIKG